MRVCGARILLSGAAIDTVFAPALLVLDTNAALDWLVFRDPGIRPWIDALAAGHVRLLSCAPMRDELLHMLGHSSLARWGVDASAAIAAYDHYATLMPPPEPGAALRLVCTDPDDQVFIDLAVVHRAGWLVTHDRALLKLTRRARVHGVQVLRPRAGIEPAFTVGLEATPTALRSGR